MRSGYGERLRLRLQQILPESAVNCVASKIMQDTICRKELQIFDRLIFPKHPNVAVDELQVPLGKQIGGEGTLVSGEVENSII